VLDIAAAGRWQDDAALGGFLQCGGEQRQRWSGWTQEYLEGYEGRLMRSLKSLLGSSLIDGRTDVQGTVVIFRDLLTRFIANLKTRAEAQGACL
jgi:hypothetical protein